MKKKSNVSGYDRLRVGSNIRKWRSIKEMKQKDLAAALRMSEASISNIENNLTDVTLSQLEDISVVLDIPVEHLFSDPQESLSGNNYILSKEAERNTLVMDKEMIYAIIGSIQKKDEQLQTVMQNVLFTMKKITQE